MTRHPVTDTIERHPVVSNPPEIPTKTPVSEQQTNKRRAGRRPKGTPEEHYARTHEARLARLKKFQFKPGESGNPKGAPRRPHITTILKQLLLSKNPANGIEEQVLVADAILSGTKMLNPTALKQTLDRVDGPVEQKVEVTTPQPIKIVLQDIGKEDGQ